MISSIGASNRIPDGYRVYWWALMMQLHRCGFSIHAISHQTQIPKSTLIGYKNLGVEPKHKDADALLWMWSEHVGGDIPLQHGMVRNGYRNSDDPDHYKFFDERQLKLPLDDD